MADRDLARQAIENMSEDLLDMGFDGPFQTVMAEGALSRAVRDASDTDRQLRVRNYLKGLVKELQTLNDPRAGAAVKRVSDAWEQFKAALTDDFGDDEDDEPTRPQNKPQKRGAGAIARQAPRQLRA